MRLIKSCLGWTSFGLLVFLFPSPRAYPTAPDRSFKFRISSAPVTLDWNLAHTSAETYIVMNLMEGLVEIDSNGQPKPVLAEKWTISPNGLVYTFTLKSGVKWSDGKPLQASDFKDSWMRLLDPKTKATYSKFLTDIAGADEFASGKNKNPNSVGIVAKDANTLEVTLKKITPHFLYLPSFWVTFPIRKDLIAKYGKAWTQPSKLVTIGPFVLSSETSATEIVLDRNPTYRQPPSPKAITRVAAQVIKDEALARKKLNLGEIDVLIDATTSDLVQLSSNPQYRVENYHYWATYYIGFNLKNPKQPLLGKTSFRKALSYAFLSERENIPSILQGGQTPAKGWLPVGISAHPMIRPPSTSAEEARQLLGQALGVNEAKPSLPSIELLIEPFDGAQRLGDYLKNALKTKLGLEITVSILSLGEFQSRLNQKTSALFLNHWGADFPDASNFFEVFRSKTPTNKTGWENAAYDALITKASNTLDQEARGTLYKEAERILLDDDAVIVPLFHRRISAIIKKDIQGFSISPLNYLFFKNLEFAKSTN